MHNKYAEAQRLLGDFSLGIMQRTTATTAPLQAMPLEVPQKEWKNISMG